MKTINLFLASAIALGTPAAAENRNDVQGFGSDIPLTFAVDQIVPEKFAVSYGAGVDVNTPVSWKGGDDWKAVLSTTLAEHGLFLEVSNTDKVRITRDAQARSKVFSGLKIASFRKNNSQTRSDSYPDDLKGKGLVFASREPSEEDQTPGISVSKHTQAKDLSPNNVGNDAILIGLDFDELAKPQKTWPIFAGDTLENTLETWAEEEGWSVAWKSRYSYPIEASAEFSGDFIAVAARLIEVFSAEAEGPETSIQGEFFKGNKVLVVKNDSSQ